jgi:transposase-like protein
LDAYFLLAKVKAKCRGKIPDIIVDKGSWYVDALYSITTSKGLLNAWSYSPNYSPYYIS